MWNWEGIQKESASCKGAQYCSLSEKCKSKQQWGTTSHQSEWPLLKSPQITNVGEGVEKRKPSNTVGGNVNWCSHKENSMKVSLKTKNTVATWSSNLTPGDIPRENYNLKRYIAMYQSS